MAWGVRNLISTQVLARRLREADAVSFALMAPCACRQARYASRCVAEANLEDDAGLQQRCAAALAEGGGLSRGARERFDE